MVLTALLEDTFGWLLCCGAIKGPVGFFLRTIILIQITLFGRLRILLSPFLAL